MVADLAVAEGREGEYTATIHQFPIDYSQEDYCHAKFTGRKVADLAEQAGPIQLPSQDPVTLTLDQVPHN